MAVTKITSNPNAGITVEGEVYDKTGDISFYTIDELLADMEINVNHTDKGYYHKEPITFTIALNRSTTAITDGLEIKSITVKDVIPSIVDFVYDTDHKTSVVVKAKNVVIDTATINYDSGTRTLSISGLNLTSDFLATDKITCDIIGTIKLK